ncbi:MAG: response regulator [Rhodospirillaceae bacterium]|nr:MAG: response regulator [Rhodospirillaceae bacterium]
MSGNQLSTVLLVVADRLAAREELAAALAPVASTRTMEAISVAEAVADLQAIDPRIDLVVIDLEMSGSGAVTLTRKIREAQTLGPRNIAILLVGGAVGMPHYQAVVRLGIQGHLPRPFTNDQLRSALRAALVARPTEPALRPTQSLAPRDAKPDTPQRPVVSTPYEAQSDVMPRATKPFRHGLQSLMRPTAPLTADDGFGFEAGPSSVRPRPMRAEPESPPMIGGLFVAVA